LRISNMFTPKECALLRWLMLEALIYFGDNCELAQMKKSCRQRR